MKNYKGLRLYIGLGPSKVRRRLKGHGFGVKKVQSAGRNQAVVIHTATGDHLRQLKQLFADVRVSDSEAEISRSLENLGDLGPDTTRADAKRD
jgi:DNA transformation protein and related proteins